LLTRLTAHCKVIKML